MRSTTATKVAFAALDTFVDMESKRETDFEDDVSTVVAKQSNVSFVNAEPCCIVVVNEWNTELFSCCTTLNVSLMLE